MVHFQRPSWRPSSSFGKPGMIHLSNFSLFEQSCRKLSLVRSERVEGTSTAGTSCTLWRTRLSMRSRHGLGLQLPLQLLVGLSRDFESPSLSQKVNSPFAVRSDTLFQRQRQRSKRSQGVDGIRCFDALQSRQSEF